jgi:hypothetical protein
MCVCVCGRLPGLESLDHGNGIWAKSFSRVRVFVSEVKGGGVAISDTYAKSRNSISSKRGCVRKELLLQI